MKKVTSLQLTPEFTSTLPKKKVAVSKPRAKKSTGSALLDAMTTSTTPVAKKVRAKKVKPDTTTTNGAPAHSTTYNNCLDLFTVMGSSRGNNITDKFTSALTEDVDISLRLLQHLRDIRGGMGEREQFRKLAMVAIHSSLVTIQQKVALIHKIPEIGRFDDLVVIYTDLASNKKRLGALQYQKLLSACVDCLYYHLKTKPNGLAFKWMPIKGVVAKLLYKSLGFKTERDWRKFIVPQRETVEQKMCALQWHYIDYSKLPSVASSRYQKAFGRRDTERYVQYLADLKNGTAKINASAVYPYDIYKSVKHGNADVAEAQWNALPNYISDEGLNIFPLIDVSGSMDQITAIPNMTAKDIAISLGLYISERTSGVFNNSFLTFESTPNLVVLDKRASLAEKFNIIYRANWGGSTNIQAAFDKILQAAVAHKIPAKDMPTHLVILSDMQFDCPHVGGKSKSTFELIEKTYKNAGYKRPQLVFWNLGNNHNSAKPITIHDTGTCMVSGFSPSAMKTVFGNNITPMQVMLETVMVDRYKL